MIQALKEKIKKLQTDQEFKRSVYQKFQTTFGKSIVLLALILFLYFAGKGCSVQELNSKTGELGNDPTQKTEVPSLSESMVPPSPSFQRKGDAK